ncbi:MAG: chain length-determining protein, partial [Nitrosomonas sp.]|nr:chain length-determining protein [Nitrosomonas sp.]
SAQMSGELTSVSGLLSFRIIDPPTVPEEPDGPNRSLFYSIVFLAALGIGIAAAFVVSQIRPAFYSQSNLREVSGLIVLGTVPMIWTNHEKTKQKRRLYAFGFSLLCLTCIYASLLMFTEKIDLALTNLPF